MGLRGPQPAPLKELAARGSWRAVARTKELAKTKKPRRKKADWHKPTDKEINKWLMKIPGYDPYRDSHGFKFKHAIARDALEFFETKLRHVEGKVAGQLFILETWQKAIICNLFGWQDAIKKVRRFREAFIYVPRKNGKTPMAAGICLFVLFRDKEAGAQIYSAAAERDQAALLYRHARGMVEQSPELTGLAKVYAGIGQRSIVLESDPASSYRVISADAYSKHGFNLHLGILDELHAQPNRELVDVLNTSMASENRRQPMMVYITTADFERESICNEKHDYACKVRDGIVEDSRFLPVIYEATTEDDWTSEETWRRVNPNIDVSVSADYLQHECKRAQETPAYENTFKRLHLNIKTQQAVRWLSIASWDECARSFDFDELVGRECVGALDLASKEDVTALIWLAKPRFDGDQWLLFPRFWVPDEGATLRERRDRVPYVTWSRAGHITLTSGSRTDYRAVQLQMMADITRLQVDQESIAADPWNLELFRQELDPDGKYIIEYGQNMKNMSGATKELSSLVASAMIHHNGNPVLRWMASNVVVKEDDNENVRPIKAKASERIDGIVATIMALGLCMSKEPPKRSVYETRGVLRV